MRVLFVGGTGPVGQASVPHLLTAGHEVAVAHTGAHEPPALAHVEHLHGERDELLAPGGAAERWRPDAIVDTFAGGATAAKARAVGDLAERAGAVQIVAVSSIDVYRHCANAGVDDHPVTPFPVDAIPLSEESPRRTEPSPTQGRRRDNVAMEDALHGAPRLTILRPGAIYGPHLDAHLLREWHLVALVAAGERRLRLPFGGTQLFHRVALDRVGRAVAASLHRAPEGLFPVNVVDPADLTYGGLAALTAEVLDLAWEPEDVAPDTPEGDHPWNTRHPVLADSTRLRMVLGVEAPDPREATVEHLRWVWEHRDAVAELMASS